MLPETHRFIIKHALQFRRKHFKGYEKEIEQACISEDNPKLSLNSEFQLFGVDHFYHPDLKLGYSRFFLNAKTKGIYLLNQAFELYKEKKFQEAFYTLGRATHYLQDIASPSHTKLSFHFAEDDFEKYVDQNIHKFKFKIRSKVIRPMKPEHCFEWLARRSHRVEYKKQNWIAGMFWDIFKKRKQLDPEKKLNKISKKLIKLSIIYTIALLNSFNRKIIKYNFRQRQKRLRQKIFDKEKKFVGKIRKSKDLVS